MEDVHASMSLLQVEMALDNIWIKSQGFPSGHSGWSTGWRTWWSAGWSNGPMDWAFWVEYWPVLKEFSACELVQLLAPMLLYLVVGCLLVLFYFRIRGALASNMQDALFMSVFAVFMENLMYSVLFVDSMGIASSNSGYEALPQAADVGAESGMIIGTQKMGTATGTLLMFLILLNWPHLWRTKAQIVYAVGLNLQILSALVFTIAGMMHVFQGLHGNVLKIALGASRFLQGLGGGIQVAFGLQQSAHLVSGDHRALQNTRFYLGACLGMGAGPLLVSATGLVAKAIPCDDAANFEITIGLIAVLPLVQLPVMCRSGFLASLKFEDAGSLTVSGQNAAPDSSCWPLRRCLTVIICLVLQVLRSLAMAAIEAAVSHLLHEWYQWSGGLTGLATAAIIFAMLPVQFLYEKIEGSCSVASSIRLLLLSAFVGSLVMAIPTAKALLFGCLLCLPSMALSSGLIMGTMQEHALPDGSILDLDKITLLTLVLSDSIGRGLGPTVALMATSLGGQQAFAWEQCLITGGCIALYEIMDRCTVVTKDAELATSEEKQGVDQ